MSKKKVVFKCVGDPDYCRYKKECLKKYSTLMICSKHKGKTITVKGAKKK
jgi:hypothetical protein